MALVLCVGLVVGAVVAWVVLELRRRAAGSGPATVEESRREMQERLEAAERTWGERLDRNTQLINQELGQVAQQLHQVLAQVNERLRENAQLLQQSNETVGNRLSDATRAMTDVHEKLGHLDQASRRIFEVGRDIAGLQDILRAPKLRGGVGELFLGTLLEQVFPRAEYYELQYAFRSGERVDAVIKLSGRLVPVDAKFPLESFQRMLAAQSDEERRTARREFADTFRRRTDEIAQKYILPDEGTYDFALMYIPAENVYYETIIKDERFGDERSLSQYAIQHNVIPASPNSFYAYLQVILFGLRGMRIEEGAREIIEGLMRLRGDFGRLREEFAKLGKHLTNAQGAFAESEKRLGRIEGKLEQLEAPTAERAVDASVAELPRFS